MDGKQEPGCCSLNFQLHYDYGYFSSITRWHGTRFYLHAFLSCIYTWMVACCGGGQCYLHCSRHSFWPIFQITCNKLSTPSIPCTTAFLSQWKLPTSSRRCRLLNGSGRHPATVQSASHPRILTKLGSWVWTILWTEKHRTATTTPGSSDAMADSKSTL